MMAEAVEAGSCRTLYRVIEITGQQMCKEMVVGYI